MVWLRVALKLAVEFCFIFKRGILMTPMLLITRFTVQFHALISVSDSDQIPEQERTYREIRLDYKNSAL